MFRSHPMIVRFGLFVVVPALAALVLAIVHFRGSLPESGATRFKAIHEEVVVSRDQHGVVTIDARTDADAFFALGFVHAQDRMWQLELQRRIASGRLSEILGATSVQDDAWMRTLGLYKAATSAWEHLSPEAQQSLTSYAAGVNAWLKTSPVLPLEFVLLGVSPEPWKEIDSLAWTKVFALGLANNLNVEVENLIASEYLDDAQLSHLTRLSESDAALRSARAAGSDASDGQLGRLATVRGQLLSNLRIGGPSVGSNAWVVAGRHMEGGAAALANDVHLGLQMPSYWYVATLRGDSLNVSGMTLVGLPIVVFGRNENVTWGGTNMMADVQDLYLEQPNPRNAAEYRRADGWKKFEAHTETIEVRASFPASLRRERAPVKIQVRSTEDGPVVSDAVGALGRPTVLKWSALQDGDTTYEAFFRVNYARDWVSFREALAFCVAPVMNMMYADAAGNIGWTAAGRIPIRAHGNGRMPVPAWTGEYTWGGYIPFDELPHVYNPPDGFIVSANDKKLDDTYPYFISDDWAPADRARRIDQLIRAKVASGKLISIEDLQRMQRDQMDLGAQKLLRLLKQIEVDGSDRRLALSHLRQWQGEMSEDSQGATIFMIWSQHLREQLFGARLGSYWNRPEEARWLSEIVSNTSYEQIVEALDGSVTGWCGSSEPSERSCESVLTSTLDLTIANLKKLKGDDIDAWRWGDLHTAVYAHVPFSRAQLLAPFFERRIPHGGSATTIDVAHARFDATSGYDQAVGASFRQIVQIGATSTHRYMNSTGQSGNVLSPHYDDMMDHFRDGTYQDVSLQASERNPPTSAPR